MKRSKTITAVKKGFQNLESLYKAINIDFEKEAIHDFRTEVKKLRAFLRLLNVQQPQELKISQKIKQFYDSIGSVRNLQLQIINVNEFVKASNDALPTTYIKKLEAETEFHKSSSLQIADHKNFASNSKKIIDRIHSGIKKRAVKKFIKEKLSELKQLLTNIQEDEVLHSIRKNLKDLLYTWPIIKSYRNSLPTAISRKKNIQSLTDILGDFCDKITGLEFLENYCIEIIAAEENEMLQKIIQKWSEEKLNLKQQILYYLRLIQ